MKRIIRIGTRRSLLAMAQSQWAGDALKAAVADIEVELVGIVTGGDVQEGPLAAIGGKGLFTAELEAALRERRIDVAVHSAKDLPACMADDLVIAAVPPREDARDALVSVGGGGLESLPQGAAVGTSSLRRGVQLASLRKDLRIVAIRGNVETRLNKALEGRDGLLAAVLAMAGLKRSGLLGLHAKSICPLGIEDVIPSAGQGALVLQCLAERTDVLKLIRTIDDRVSHGSLLAERTVVANLGADCRSCLAVHVMRRGDEWVALSMAARPDGRDTIRPRASARTAQQAAAVLLEQLLQAGARELLIDKSCGES